MNIPPQDYVEYAPSVVGEQVNINHTNCTAGLDRKKRLYIKRTDKNIIAYCHHCGGKGIFYPNKPTHLEVLKNKITAEEVTSFVDTVFMPSDVEMDVNKWDKDAQMWVYKYNISNEMIAKHHLCYSKRLHRVILPVYDDEGILVFWQARALDKQTLPKYLNKKSVAKPYMFLRTDNLTSFSANTVVIVEDILSAIKVSEVANAVALLGTTLTNETMLRIRAAQPSKVVVWLDADMAGWKGKMAACRKLSLMFPVVSYVTSDKQPKEASIAEIMECIS